MTVEAYQKSEEKSIENAISPDKILVFDMNGNLVLEVKPEEGKTTLSLAGLKDGEYIVHVVIGKEVAKKHIIKV